MVAAVELTNSSLHHRILSTIVDRGYAPSVDELTEWSGSARTEVAAALTALAEYHGVVLHPASGEIWIAHPFSLAPTAFTVTAHEQRWWGTCAWCSLGAVELLGGTATITTQLAWSGEVARVRVEAGQLLDTDHVIHFPIPMTEAWNNVVYTCSMMLLFRDGDAVNSWCARHGKLRGDVRPVEQIWHFAQEWYGRHLDTNWRKWTAAEAAALFERHGLDGPIWSLPTVEERF